ncbi:MAG TPA: 6,7-dimethyl-8-ribityllumazine synthase [Candidatus Baltobacteraceae bacterium]|nr:6,7-dimethyl-8-ribityllumazine synthase [Candidatus Baltobacteraceae bacterium]
MKTNGSSRPEPPNCSGKRFAIVAARFYGELADQLVDGAMRALRDCGVAGDDVDVYNVPGCFELPLACRNLVDTDRYDALVALGVVIRGETPHFDFVAGECARGIMDVQLASGVPIGFGVLTTEDVAQAQERADPQRGDKGYEAAIAAATLLRITAGVPRAGFRS